MAHRYGIPIRMKHAKDGTPHAFIWHGENYHVEEVLGTWHLQDRWWVTPTAFTLGTEPRNHSDRQYYRLRVEGHQVFDVYHDTISNAWVLDMVQD